MTIKLFHQIFGILVLIIFLLTGQYMDIYYNHLQDMPDGLRMLFRSRHIYILLAGLLNVGIGSYLAKRSSIIRRSVQYIGSSLIVLSTFLLIGAFFYEPKLADLQTPLSPWGIYTIVAGTLLHLFSGIGENTTFRISSVKSDL